jgi:hypothetical protein
MPIYDWVRPYEQAWSRRFDRLDTVLEELVLEELVQQELVPQENEAEEDGENDRDE